jgi:NAD(P)-dependent dehydrogenase (short-subunit alcohol dehydrogenase family)
MINRKEEQGTEAIQKIKQEAGDDAAVEWIGCDLGNLSEVKKVFDGIRKREKRMDLVCLKILGLILASCRLTGDCS